MKKLLVILAGLIGLSGAVLYVSAHAASRYLARAETSETSVCKGHYATHAVAIRKDTVAPAHTEAALCDSLIITNYDDKARLMAFGNHLNHQTYDGVSERVLHASQSLSITLDKAGAFTFHDHLQDEVAGSFTVTPPAAIVK